MSAGYPEDKDEGDKFTYTGSGGRDLKTKNLRTGVQTFDQELKGPNLGLYRSWESGRPIRVLRGYKAELGPVEGYRYDGLYTCVKAYEAKNVMGRHLVWKYELERVGGQVPADYEGMWFLTVRQRCGESEG